MKPAVVGGLIALGLSSQGAASDENRDAWITSTESSDSITLQALARLDRGESGHYQLTVRKKGQSGSSTTRQAGNIPPGDGETVSGPLMTSRLSFRTGESIEAILIVETSMGRELRDIVNLTSDE